MSDLCLLSLHPIQEGQREAQRKEAAHRGEEALPGRRIHQSKSRGFWTQGAGGVAEGDRPERMAR